MNAATRGRLAVCLAVAATATACGGGGGGGSSQAMAFASSVPDAADGRIDLSPAGIGALVLSAEQGAVAWANERGSSSREYAASVRETRQATNDLSGAMCTSGTASAEFSDELGKRMERSGGIDWRSGDRILYRFSRCVLSGNTFYGGSGLYPGSVVDGRVEYQMMYWGGSFHDFVERSVYRDFYVTLPGGRTRGRPAARLSTTVVGSSVVWSYDTGSEAFIGFGGAAPVSTSGDLITVASGVRRAPVPGTGGYLDAAYDGWTYDTAQHRATAGQVTFTGRSGTDAAVVHAPAAPGAPYRVTLAGGAVFECSDHDHCVQLP